jgi:hypothetical protein
MHDIVALTYAPKKPPGQLKTWVMMAGRQPWRQHGEVIQPDALFLTSLCNLTPPPRGGVARPGDDSDVAMDSGSGGGDGAIESDDSWAADTGIKTIDDPQGVHRFTGTAREPARRTRVSETVG